MKKFSVAVFFAIFFLFISQSIQAVENDAANGDSSSTSDEEAPLTKNPEEYNVLPLILTDRSGSVDANKLITNLVYDQGYEAHCANTEWQISKDVWGDIQAYFTNNPNGEDFWDTGAVNFSGTTPYVVDLTKAHIPLLRGMEVSELTMKNSSFEGFFGANLPDTDKEELLSTDPDVGINISGVAENLSTNYVQCIYKKNNIDAIGKVCSFLGGAETCYLNRQIEVPNDSSKGVTGKDIKLLDIQKLFEEIRPSLSGNELNKAVCMDITGGDTANTPDPNLSTPQASQNQLNFLQTAMNAAPFDIDNLYRLGFLILAPKQDVQDNEDKFSFLQSPPSLNQKLDAPIIVAFKIPNFATNKSYTIGDVDSLELTKMYLQSMENNQADLADQKKKREELTEKTKAANGLSPNDRAINCDGLPQCARTETNLLTNAIIDLVNASRLDCKNETLQIVEDTEETKKDPMANSSVSQIFNQEDLNFEKAGDLYTPANKDLKDYDYSNLINNQLIKRLTSNEQQSFSWQLNVDTNPPKAGENIIVNAYLVLPVGETVKDANKSFVTQFWSQDLFTQMVSTNTLADMKNKAGAIPKFYTIKGESSNFSAGASKDFCANYETVTEYDENNKPITTTKCTDKKSFGINLTDNKKQLLIPDFGLGWLIWQIQRSVRSTVSETYAYISSCQRVEDLFLGKCGGRTDGDKTTAVCDSTAFEKIAGMPTATSVPEEAHSYFTQYVLPKITDTDKEAYAAAEEATGIPCAVAAGIHWTEGGSEENRSLNDGHLLDNSSQLRADAIANMKLLKEIIVADGDDPNNLTYAALINAIAQYNGLGNGNCSEWHQDVDLQSGPRPTRWREAGKCSNVQPQNSDQPHPTAWIDENHMDMDLIFCLDGVEFSCQQDPGSVDLNAIKERITRALNIKDPDTLNGLANSAKSSCFSGSAACATSNGRKYPPYLRIGSLTTAVLLNDLGN